MCWTCSQGYPGVGEALSSFKSVAPIVLSTVGIYLALHFANIKVLKKNDEDE